MNTQTEIKCPFCKDNTFVKLDGDEYECYRCGYTGKMDIDTLLKDILKHDDKDRENNIKWITAIIVFVILFISLAIYNSYTGITPIIRFDGQNMRDIKYN